MVAVYKHRRLLRTNLTTRNGRNPSPFAGHSPGDANTPFRHVIHPRKPWTRGAPKRWDRRQPRRSHGLFAPPRREDKWALYMHLQHSTNWHSLKWPWNMDRAIHHIVNQTENWRDNPYAFSRKRSTAEQQVLAAHRILGINPYAARGGASLHRR